MGTCTSCACTEGGIQWEHHSPPPPATMQLSYSLEHKPLS